MHSQTPGQLMIAHINTLGPRQQLWLLIAAQLPHSGSLAGCRAVSQPVAIEALSSCTLHPVHIAGSQTDILHGT